MYTITNDGNADLDLTTLSSSNPLFTVSAFSTDPVPPSGTSTFTVTFTPTANGAQTSTISIGSNDCDEDPYTFDVSGTGQACSVSLATPVTVAPNCPGGNDGTITATATCTGCSGITYTLSGDATGTNTDGMFTGLAAGTYTVTAANTADGTCNDVEMNVVVAAGVDNTPPEIVCPAAPAAVDATTAAGAIVTWTAPTGTDNCPSPVTTRTVGDAPGSTFPIGTTPITYSVTDGVNTPATCSFNVVVNPTTPVITCPGNVTVNAATGTCAATVDFAASTPATATGFPAPVITYSPASNTSFDVGSTTVTATATNIDGSVNCTFNVIVVDNQAPEIVCPAAPTAVDATTAAGAIVTWTAPTGTDNCPSPVTTRTVGNAPGSTFPIGTTPITYSVTDGVNTPATCSFNVVVNPTTPVITCPGNVTVNAATGTCAATVDFAASTPATATGFPAPVITYSPASNTSFDVGSTTVTATATNIDGSVNCTFNVIVVDNQAPEIVCPAAPTAVDATTAAGATVTWTAPIGTDNCPSPVTTRTAGDAPGSTFPIGTTLVTYEVTDGTNTIDCSFNVTVEEVAPVLNCPTIGNVTVNSADNCTNSVNFPAATVNSGTGFPNPTIVYTIPGTPNPTVITAPYDFPIGTTTVTATATNSSPGSATGTCTFDVTVMAPEITVDNATPGPDAIGSVVQTEDVTSTQTFTITNTGNAPLTLGDIIVAGTGANAAEAAWTIVDGPASGTELAINTTATFKVNFDPDNDFIGTAEALVAIVSDDCDEAPYTFTVSAESLEARVYNTEKDRYYANLTDAINDLTDNAPNNEVLTISPGTYMEGMDLTNKNATVKFGPLPGL